MPSPVRVLAVGWFGEGNLGDEAMLEGLLRVLERSLGPAEVTVSTGDPDGTRARFGTPTLQRRPPAKSGYRDLALVRASLRSSLVTLGGGDLIREQADGTVPALNWLDRMRVPHGLGRPTALVGVSVGELFTPTVVRRVAKELRRFTLLAVRDTASATRLRELTDRDVHVMGDLALEAIDPLPPRVSAGPPRIGVATRAIAGRGPSVPDAAGQRLESALATALDQLVREAGIEVELIPFRARSAAVARDDDRRAGESLAAAAASGAAWIRREPPRDAAGFRAIAADLDLVVAVRLHAAVLGAGAGRRIVGISYDPKVEGFLSDIGVPGQTLPLDTTADQIVEAVLRSLGDHGLEEAIRGGVASARARTSALEPMLAAAAGRARP